MSTRSVIEAYMNKMYTGDFPGAFKMFHPQGRYTIIGDTPVSQTFTGPDGIAEVLVPLLAEGFKGLPVIHLDELIIDGDRGVALGHGEAPAKYGTYLQKHYAFVFKVDGEQVMDLVEFMDPTQLSTKCFGQKLSPIPD